MSSVPFIFSREYCDNCAQGLKMRPDRNSFEREHGAGMKKKKKPKFLFFEMRFFITLRKLCVFHFEHFWNCLNTLLNGTNKVL